MTNSKNTNQSRSHKNDEPTLNSEVLNTLATESSELFENAQTRAEALAAEVTRDMSADEAEIVKKQLMAKEIQNTFRSVAYPVLGGFQPSQKRYWADVAVRSAANTLFLMGAIAGGAYLLRRKEGDTTATATGNPFDQNVTATERPSRNRASASA